MIFYWKKSGDFGCKCRLEIDIIEDNIEKSMTYSTYLTFEIDKSERKREDNEKRKVV